MSVSHTGKERSAAHRAALSTARRGKKLPRDRVEKQRESLCARLGVSVKKAPGEQWLRRTQRAAWAEAVIRRDHGTCSICGFVKKGRGSVHAHHILSVAKHPERALSINNGITLCTPCHVEEHRVNGIV